MSKNIHCDTFGSEVHTLEFIRLPNKEGVEINSLGVVTS